MTLTPLAALRKGDEAIVAEIIGGRGATSKLMAMGIVPGKKIKVVDRRGGAMLVSVNGTKFVIGHGLAMKVMVRETD